MDIHKIDWSKNRYDAGRQAFVKQSITTPTKYAAHLNGSAASDKAAKALVLENTPDNLHAWLYDPQKIKPGVLMPGYQDMSEEDLQALVEYLGGLK